MNFRFELEIQSFTSKVVINNMGDTIEDKADIIEIENEEANTNDHFDVHFPV